MEFVTTSLPDVLLVNPQVLVDSRGSFMEVYEARKFAAASVPSAFVQDNQSRSRRGTLRGLHYQIQQPQGKLVRVLAGEVFDVAVDLRRRSPSFGQWVSAVLSAENHLMLWVPPGFAHGFYVLSEWADVLYKMTDYYAPEWERSLLWNDPSLGIPWPLVDGEFPLLSAKDAAGSPLRSAETYE